jgi:hypothetical protein
MRFHHAALRKKFLSCTTLWGLTPRSFTRRFFSPPRQPKIPAKHHLRPSAFFSRAGAQESAVKDADDWKVYRTRYLVRARQLTAPLSIVDGSGKEQSGHEGDYLVECSDGSHRIAPRQIFEDIYVEMGAPVEARMFSLIRGLRRPHVVAGDDPNQSVLFSLTG